MPQNDRLDKFLEKHIPVSKPKIQSLAKYQGNVISPCYEFAAMGAEALTSCGREEVYLIYAYEHVVVYDLIDTWDFMFNAVFRNYRYPMLNPTKLEKIWEDVPINTYCKKYYRFNSVPRSVPIAYKLVKNL